MAGKRVRVDVFEQVAEGAAESLVGSDDLAFEFAWLDVRLKVGPKPVGSSFWDRPGDPCGAVGIDNRVQVTTQLRECRGGEARRMLN